MTSSADAIALVHLCWTHIDALSHDSCTGFFDGDRKVEHTYEHGMSDLGVNSIENAIVRRGVLLDVAALEGLATSSQPVSKQRRIICVAPRESKSRKATSCRSTPVWV